MRSNFMFYLLIFTLSITGSSLCVMSGVGAVAAEKLAGAFERTGDKFKEALHELGPLKSLGKSAAEKITTSPITIVHKLAIDAETMQFIIRILKKIETVGAGVALAAVGIYFLKKQISAPWYIPKLIKLAATLCILSGLLIAFR